jgi:hypothetical protein
MREAFEAMRQAQPEPYFICNERTARALGLLA